MHFGAIYNLISSHIRQSRDTSAWSRGTLARYITDGCNVQVIKSQHDDNREHPPDSEILSDGDKRRH